MNGQTYQYNLLFTADTSKAKTEINNMAKSLNGISTLSNVDLSKGITPGLKQASKAAAEFEAILKRAYDPKTNTMDFTQIQNGLKQSGMSVKQFTNELRKAGPQGEQAIRDIANSLSSVQAKASSVTALFGKMWTSLKQTARYQLSNAILSGFTSSIREAYQYAQDLNKSLNDIRIVTGYNIDKMADFAKEANKAAKALSTSTNEYTKASLIYYQQGLADQAVKERTDVTVKLANVTGESAQKVSEQMTAIWNNFDDGSKSLEYYADVITALGAATASSTDEISQGLEKFAATAETIGLSYEYATAALATVTAQTRQSADVVGTAFKTMFARIQGLKLGETLEDGTNLNQYSEALSKIGVNIKDSNGNLKEMDAILNEMGAKWDTLNKDQQVATAQQVAGLRQYNQLMALMDNWDFFQKNLNTATTSTGELNKQADTYAESWEAASKRVQASAETIYGALLDDKFFIELTNGFAEFLDGVNNTIKALGGLKGLLPTVISLMTSLFQPQMSAALNSGIGIIQNRLFGAKNAANIRSEFNQASQRSADAADATYADKARITADNRINELKNESFSNPEKLSPEELQLRNTNIARAENLKQASIQKAEIADVAMADRDAANEKVQALGKKYGVSQTEITKYQQDQSALNTKEAELSKYFSKTESISETGIKKVLGDDFTKKEIKAIYGTGDKNAAKEAAKNAFQKKRDATKQQFESKLTKSPETNKQEKTPLQDGEKIKEQHVASQIIDQQTVKSVDENGSDTKLTQDNPEIKGEVEGVEELTAAVEEREVAERNYQKAAQESVDAEEEHLRVADEMSKLPPPTINWGQSMMATASMITATSGALNNLKGIWDVMKDPDMSGWDKATSIMSSLGMTVMSVAMAFNKDNRAIIANTASVIANSAVNSNFLGVKSVMSKLTAAATKATEGDTRATILNTLAKYASYWYITLIIAALALVAAGFYYLATAESAEEKAAKKALETQKALQESYQQSVEELQTLKDKLESLKESEEAFEKLTKGTDEWKEALRELNKESRELLKEFPQIVSMVNANGEKAIRYEGGRLIIADWAKDQLLDSAEIRTNRLENAVVLADQAVRETSLDLKKANTRGPGIDSTSDADQSSYQKATNKARALIYSGEEYSFEKLLQILRSENEQLAGVSASFEESQYKKFEKEINEAAEAFLTVRESIEENNYLTEQENTLLASQMQQGNQNIQNSEYVDEIAEITGQALDAQKKKLLESKEYEDFGKAGVWKSSGANTKAKEYFAEYAAAAGLSGANLIDTTGIDEKRVFVYTDANGIEHKVGLDEMKNTLVAQELEGWSEKTGETIANVLREVTPEIGNIIVQSATDNGNYNANIVNELLNFEGSELTTKIGTYLEDTINVIDAMSEEEIEALYGEGATKDSVISDIKKDLEESVKNYQKQLTQISFKGFTEQAKKITNASQNAIITYGKTLDNISFHFGEETASELNTQMEILLENNKEQQEEILALYNSQDWESPRQALSNFQKGLIELGATVDLSSQDWIDLRNNIKKVDFIDVNKNLDNFITKLQELNTILGELGVGSIIDETTYNKIIENDPLLASKFVKTVGGYIFTGDEADLEDAEQDPNGLINEALELEQKKATLSSTYQNLIKNKDIEQLSFDSTGALQLGDSTYKKIDSRAKEPLNDIRTFIEKIRDSFGPTLEDAWSIVGYNSVSLLELLDDGISIDEMSKLQEAFQEIIKLPHYIKTQQATTISNLESMTVTSAKNIKDVYTFAKTDAQKKAGVLKVFNDLSKDSGISVDTLEAQWAKFGGDQNAAQKVEAIAKRQIGMQSLLNGNIGEGEIDNALSGTKINQDVKEALSGLFGISEEAVTQDWINQNKETIKKIKNFKNEEQFYNWFKQNALTTANGQAYTGLEFNYEKEVVKSYSVLSKNAERINEIDNEIKQIELDVTSGILTSQEAATQLITKYKDQNTLLGQDLETANEKKSEYAKGLGEKIYWTDDDWEKFLDNLELSGQEQLAEDYRFKKEQYEKAASEVLSIQDKMLSNQTSIFEKTYSNIFEYEKYENLADPFAETEKNIKKCNKELKKLQDNYKKLVSAEDKLNNLKDQETQLKKIQTANIQDIDNAELELKTFKNRQKTINAVNDIQALAQSLGMADEIKVELTDEGFINGQELINVLASKIDAEPSEAMKTSLTTLLEMIKALFEDQTKLEEMLEQFQADLVATNESIQENKRQQVLAPMEARAAEAAVRRERYERERLFIDEENIYNAPALINNSVASLKESSSELSALQSELSTLYANREAWGEDEAGWKQAIAEKEKQITEELKNQLAILKEIEQTYRDTYEQIHSIYDRETEKFGELNSELEHMANLLELLNRDEEYSTFAEIYKSQYKNLETLIYYDKQQLEGIKKSIAAVKAEMEGLDPTSDLYQKLQKDLEQYETLYSTTFNNIISQTEELADLANKIFENAVAKNTKAFQEAVSGGTSLDNLIDRLEKIERGQEKWLDAVNQTYETTTLLRKIDTEMNKTTTKAGQQKLVQFKKEIQEMQKQGQLSKFELEIAQKKYDILLAEIALQEAQNAKTEVRLVRNASGGWNYIYTSDLEAVREAEQKLADEENEYYNELNEREREQKKEIYGLMQDAAEDINSLYDDYMAGKYTKEQYQKEKERRIKYWRELIQAETNIYAQILKEQGKDIDEAKKMWTDFDEHFTTLIENNDIALAEWGENTKNIFDAVGENAEETGEKINDLNDRHNELAENVEKTVIPSLEILGGKISILRDEYYKLYEQIKDVIEAAVQMGDIQLPGGGGNTTTTETLTYNEKTDYAAEIIKAVINGDKELAKQLLAQRALKLQATGAKDDGPFNQKKLYELIYNQFEWIQENGSLNGMHEVLSAIDEDASPETILGLLEDEVLGEPLKEAIGIGEEIYEATFYGFNEVVKDENGKVLKWLNIINTTLNDLYGYSGTGNKGGTSAGGSGGGGYSNASAAAILTTGGVKSTHAIMFRQGNLSAEDLGLEIYNALAGEGLEGNTSAEGFIRYLKGLSEEERRHFTMKDVVSWLYSSEGQKVMREEEREEEYNPEMVVVDSSRMDRMEERLIDGYGLVTRVIPANGSEAYYINENFEKIRGMTYDEFRKGTIPEPVFTNGETEEEEEIDEEFNQGSNQWSVSYIDDNGKVVTELFDSEEEAQIVANTWGQDVKLVSAATGGYTGKFGPEGRLALLHEKELVLNQHDTKNMLDIVSLTRDFVKNIAGQGWTRLTQLGSTLGNLFEKSTIVEQNISIEASFPNVQDRNEIDEAFNNLINQATQYVYRKK